jgi:hypothetical protein
MEIDKSVSLWRGSTERKGPSVRWLQKMDVLR